MASTLTDMAPRVLLFALLSLCGLLLPRAGDAAGKTVSDAELQQVYAAYRKAKAAGFSRESVIALYQHDNGVSAVKKLIDMEQSNPAFSIPRKDSDAIAGVRQEMNMRILDKLAKITGGTIEVLDFGKENGARSDLDQTIFAVDGRRYYKAGEMKQLYQRLWNDEYKVDMERMDMAMFNGDAHIPDWRRQDQTYLEFVVDYAERQQLLEEQRETYTEPGAYRAQVNRRSRDKGRVTLVNYKGDDSGDADPYTRERGPASELSSRYKDYVDEIPYRNAMSATFGNMKKFKGTEDFIDRMKYFNRVMGDGVNALPQSWGVDYLDKMGKLRTEDPAGYERMIRNLVADVYPELSKETRKSFTRIIRLSADIELDKIQGATKSQSHYLRGEIDSIRRAAQARGEQLSDEQVLSKARNNLFEHQQHIMQRSLVATARTKIRMDLDQDRLDMLDAKYPDADLGRKLQFDTAHQIQRIFNAIDDEAAVRHIIAEAPLALRPVLHNMNEAAQIVREQRARNQARPKLAEPDPEAAKRQGPQEQDVLQPLKSRVVQKKTAVAALLAQLQKKYDDFDVKLRAGHYSDEAISARMRGRVLDALGFEERAVYQDMKASFERKFSGSRLMHNVVNLGNVDALVNVLKVYQQTGDMQQVAHTALWELVSNLPYVAKVARLRQIYNDGDYQGLAWMCIAWKLPVAGQVKMVFDVAKNSVEVFYNHLMIPLGNDRFDLVYQGYVEAQPAGWSPFQPGWKERQVAQGRSILHWVPGKTFGEKRSNMYAFFQAKLDEKLRAGGLDPSSTDYWEAQERILPAFFGKYVTDYLNGTGDWSDNVIAGLYGTGTQAELKQRLIRRLLTDFRQGEMNFRMADAAREEMMDALQKVDEVQQENAQAERQLAAIEDFLGDKAGAEYAEALQHAHGKARQAPQVQAESYPHTVVAGEQATIAVKLVEDLGEQEGETVRPSDSVVEVRPVAESPLIAGESDVKLERLQETIGDTELVAPLTRGAETLKGRTYLARTDFLVTVRGQGGKVLGERKVSINVMDLVRGRLQDQLTAVRMLVKRILPRKQPVTPRKPGQVAGLLSNAIPIRYEWAELEPRLATPWYKDQPDLRGSPKLSLLIRWPDGPTEPGTRWVVGRIHGGIPPFEKAIKRTISGSEKFADPTQGMNPYAPGGPPGNAFAFALPMERGHAGEFTVEGELRYSSQRISSRKLDKAEPEARHPFSISFRYQAPRRRVTKASTNYREGKLDGYIKVENCQDGTRVAALSGGGLQRYALLTCRGGKGSVHLDHMWPDRPQALSISFPDFGETVNLQAALEYRSVREVAPVDDKRVARAQKRIDRYLKTRDKRNNLLYLAQAYGGLASTYHGYSGGMRDVQRWLDVSRRELDAWQALFQAAQNRSWDGYRGYPGYRNPEQREQMIDKLQSDWRYLWFKAVADKAAVAARYDLTEQAQGWLTMAEEIGTPLLDHDKLGSRVRDQLKTAGRAMARSIFRTSGDLDATRSAWDWLNKLYLRGNPGYKPGRFPWAVDVVSN